MGKKRPSCPPVRYSDGFMWGNLTAAIIKAGTYYYSGAPNFTPVFQWCLCFFAKCFVEHCLSFLFVLNFNNIINLWYLHYVLKFLYLTIVLLSLLFQKYLNRIGGVMVSVLASIAVDRGFEPRSDQTKVYIIGICCFSAKHAAIRRKNKDWLARNQNNMSEWSNMSIRRLLFQWASTIKIHLSVLV